MLNSGLVSVSFRFLKPEEIIRLTVEAGLSGIEWGGDVHVPPEDLTNAKKIGELTRASGLAVSAYGSYYRLGQNGEMYQAEFKKVLSTAKALGAPVIRLWAGTGGSEKTDEFTRKALVKEARILARMAREQNILAAFECHPDTLTDCCASSLRLMREIDDEYMKMYWQPNQNLPFADNLHTLGSLLPYLVNIHVFHWPRPGVREPLVSGENEWRQYLSVVASLKEEHFCSLEFMPDDDPKSLKHEANTLNRWLQNISEE